MRGSGFTNAFRENKKLKTKNANSADQEKAAEKKKKKEEEKAVEEMKAEEKKSNLCSSHSWLQIRQDCPQNMLLIFNQHLILSQLIGSLQSAGVSFIFKPNMIWIMPFSLKRLSSIPFPSILTPAPAKGKRNQQRKKKRKKRNTQLTPLSKGSQQLKLSAYTAW